MEKEKIDLNQAHKIISKKEDHFFDFTDKMAKGALVQKKCTAFANADGGELYIGIRDRDDVRNKGFFCERWDGFQTYEEANPVIQNLYAMINPKIETMVVSFVSISGYEDKGIVVKVSLRKSPDIHEASNGHSWVRKGAQCLKLNSEEVHALKLSRGGESYEEKIVSECNIDDISSSAELRRFLEGINSRLTPEEFLERNYLVSSVGEVKYSAVLLFHPVPQAVLKKKCSVKIVRYNTSENKPERRHLEITHTIEGPLNEQIKKSLEKIKQIIDGIPIMTPQGPQMAVYPIDSIKEVLVNAIIHRDYNLSNDVIVEIYNNRIIVNSPGILPGHITTENIFSERYSRNSQIVRILHTYKNPPNQDIGEGLKTAQQKMQEVRLKPLEIVVQQSRVIATLPHTSLAAPEDQILEYLEKNEEITNSKAREITGIRSENKVKSCFYKLRRKGILEQVPNKLGSKSAWRKTGYEPEGVELEQRNLL